MHKKCGSRPTPTQPLSTSHSYINYLIPKEVMNGTSKLEKSNNQRLHNEAVKKLQQIKLQKKELKDCLTVVFENQTSLSSVEEGIVVSNGGPSVIRRKRGTAPKEPVTETYNNNDNNIINTDNKSQSRSFCTAIKILVQRTKRKHRSLIGIKLLLFGILFIALFGALEFTSFRHIRSIRRIRKATVALMNDADLHRSLEESSGYKFVDMHEYMDMVNELNEKTKSINTLRATIEARDELQTLLSSLDLDMFCPECVFMSDGANNTTCMDRVRVMVKQQHIPKFEAMSSLLEQESCRKQSWKSKVFSDWRNNEKPWERLAKDNKAVQNKKGKPPDEVIDGIVKHWSIHKDDFCGTCHDDMSTITCTEQVDNLVKHFNTPLIVAHAKVMFGTAHCRHSFYRTLRKKTNDQFCGECVWGNSSDETCTTRMIYLMNHKRMTRDMAQVEVMRKKACRMA